MHQIRQVSVNTIFNCVKYSWKKNTHSSKQDGETPLQWYVALKIHSTTWKATVVVSFSSLDCVLYIVTIVTIVYSI